MEVAFVGENWRVESADGGRDLRRARRSENPISIGRADSSLLPSVSGFDEYTRGDVGVVNTKFEDSDGVLTWRRPGGQTSCRGNAVCSGGGSMVRPVRAQLRNGFAAVGCDPGEDCELLASFVNMP